MKKVAFLTLTMLLWFCYGSVSQAGQSSSDLSAAWKIIRSKQFVDLTHAFEPGIPHWKGFADEKREPVFSYAKDGFLVHLYTHV